MTPRRSHSFRLFERAMNVGCLDPHDALLIVDVQNDFLPGGRLAVANGDQVVPVLKRAIALFARQSLPIVATRDWHPPNHCSFTAQGGPWPPHCIAHSEGAAFAAGLALPPDAIVVSKASTPDKDAYSGFEGTDLASRLRAGGSERLFIGGLATDYCVLNTVKDALALGFRVLLLEDAIRAVDVKPGDGQAAIEQMIGLGAIPSSVAELDTALAEQENQQGQGFISSVS
jgi:nicotinamidase/pyrazinamidase